LQGRVESMVRGIHYTLTRLLVLAVAVLVFSVNSVEAATIVFQEGVDGYSGCTDSYIGNGGYSAFRAQNFGTAPNMLYGQESYQSG
jgi:hypothetical protein